MNEHEGLSFKPLPGGGGAADLALRAHQPQDVSGSLDDLTHQVAALRADVAALAPLPKQNAPALQPLPPTPSVPPAGGEWRHSPPSSQSPTLQPLPASANPIPATPKPMPAPLITPTPSQAPYWQPLPASTPPAQSGFAPLPPVSPVPITPIGTTPAGSVPTPAAPQFRSYESGPLSARSAPSGKSSFLPGGTPDKLNEPQKQIELLENIRDLLKELLQKMGSGQQSGGPQRGGGFVPGGPRAMANERREEGGDLIGDIARTVGRAALGRVAPWTLAVEGFLNRRR